MNVPFLDLRAAYDELRAELDAAVLRAAGSGWYIQGPEVETFEASFARYCTAAHCVGTGNGLDALHLALRALGIGEGDEVIVPSNTFIASWLAITQVGAIPVAVEPREATHNLDPTRLEAAIGPRTRAIMPVHLYGQPAELDTIIEIARRHGLKVIEDAAQAHGARWRGRRIGAQADAVAWSFYPGKNLGALGDGGAITTDDASLAERVRMLGNYGSKRKYVHEVRGYNSRLDPMQAAALSVKLAHLDRWNARRAAIARQYTSVLSTVDGLTLPQVADGAESVWHLFVVRHPQRDRLQAHLAARGVQTLIHYPVPPHRQGAYTKSATGRDLDTNSDDPSPLATRLSGEVLSLPIGPHLSPPQVERVINAVLSFAA